MEIITKSRDFERRILRCYRNLVEKGCLLYMQWVFGEYIIVTIKVYLPPGIGGGGGGPPGLPIACEKIKTKK